MLIIIVKSNQMMKIIAYINGSLGGYLAKIMAQNRVIYRSIKRPYKR